MVKETMKRRDVIYTPKIVLYILLFHNFLYHRVVCRRALFDTVKYSKMKEEKTGPCVSPVLHTVRLVVLIFHRSYCIVHIYRVRAPLYTRSRSSPKKEDEKWFGNKQLRGMCGILTAIRNILISLTSFARRSDFFKWLLSI